MTYEMYTHFYPATRISQLFYPLAVKNLHQNHTDEYDKILRVVGLNESRHEARLRLLIT